jgi:arylsulfatase A-like enzyme
MTRKPNLLFIVLDTLRRDHLGSYGYNRPTSPQLDAFASRSTLFKRAIAPAQWTVPSHASMFTGTYPQTHHVTQANSQLSGAHPTLAEILSAADYQTVAFCNNPLVGVLNNGLQRGFAEFYNYASAVPQRPNEAQRGALYREFMRRFRPFARRTGNMFAQNDAMFRMALNPFWVPIWSKYINFKGNTALSIADLTDYWQQHHAGGAQRPLFAFLNLMQSHLPFQPSQAYVDRVAPQLRNDRRAYQFMGRFNADGAGWASPPQPPLEDWQERVLNDFYDAEIAYQDELLGQLLTYLEQSGQLDNTFVLISADHGEALGDHNMVGHGFTVHQELVHVPLIMRGADRVPDGGLVTENVSTRRIFHTLLDVAGAKPPLAADDPNANVAHLSLLNAVREHDSEDDAAYSEAIPPSTFLHVLEHRNPAVIAKLRLDHTRRALYSGDHKLTTVGDNAEGLYDVAADPTETTNILPHRSDVAAKLLLKLTTFAQGGAQRGEAAHSDVSDEVMDQLRALGYVD